VFRARVSKICPRVRGGPVSGEGSFETSVSFYFQAKGIKGGGESGAARLVRLGGRSRKYFTSRKDTAASRRKPRRRQRSAGGPSRNTFLRVQAGKEREQVDARSRGERANRDGA